MKTTDAGGLDYGRHSEGGKKASKLDVFCRRANRIFLAIIRFECVFEMAVRHSGEELSTWMEIEIWSSGKRRAGDKTLEDIGI